MTEPSDPDPAVAALHVPPFNPSDLDFSVPFTRVWARMKSLAESKGLAFEPSAMDAMVSTDPTQVQGDEGNLTDTILSLKQRLAGAKAIVSNVPGIGLSEREQADMLADFVEILEEKRAQLKSYLALPIFEKLGLDVEQFKVPEEDAMDSTGLNDEPPLSQ
ncbi:hypothetical protein HDU93_005168 [Gonapodya sp. JEL0774]|nr:hypothetical protein HDU93_005168 [Gonapodya sp. JEL0774]